MGKQIAWNDGSGDYITLTYQGQGDGPVVVESDENGGAARSQIITLKTTKGSPVVTKSLTVNQAACPFPVGDIRNFEYTGGKQEILLPKGQYKLQCWGAQGGSVSGSYTATGSKGGYSEGILTLTKATKVYVFVGGQGSSAATSITGGMQNGGFNGGGGAPRRCQYNSGDNNGISYPRPGGGATDISLVDSDVAYNNYRTNRSEASLLARLIVAGGGAGASARYTETTSNVSVSGTMTADYYIGPYGGGLEELDFSELLTDKFWYTDGSIRSNSNFAIKKYSITPGRTYHFYGSFGNNSNIYFVGWYDSSGNLVSYETYGLSNSEYRGQAITAPSGSSYLYLNISKTRHYVVSKKPSTSFKYYSFPVSVGQTYNVVVPTIEKADSNYHPIYFGTHPNNDIAGYDTNSFYSWNTPSQGFNGTITIPSGCTYLYITVNTNDSAPTVSYTTTSTSSGVSNGSQVGGGTSGGGTSPGTQSGGGGELGKGANMTATNYRYASGGGGGGYYGGGTSYDDSTINKINQSGGGSGFVSSDLANAQTKAGNTSFPSTSGGTETGHSGNGYTRITRIA